ncbi:MAG: anti-sigma factor family protein [Planctomycetota bacterium JB042]
MPDDMTPPPDCRRFRSLLEAQLAGDLDGPLAAWAAEHSAGCAGCRAAAAEAREAEDALHGWTAPEPPEGLRDRILRRALAEHAPDRVACGDLRADLDVWIAGDLSEARGRALEAHLGTCPPCAHEARVARDVEALLRGWVVPLPPAGLKARLLDLHVRSDRALRLAGAAAPVAGGAPERPGPAVGSFPRRAALAAAAAILVTSLFALLGSRDDRGAASDVARPVRMETVDDLVKRYGGDVRVRAVANQQFPASVGRFSDRPPITDRVRRPSGNAFHRSLRRALTEADAGGEGR